MNRKETSELITPAQYAAWMQPHINRSITRVGLVAHLDDENQLLAKGTCFFAQVGARKVVVTARHVVREWTDEKPQEARFTSSRLRIMTFPANQQLGEVSIPEGVDLGEQDLVWEDARLDVAIFNAPVDLIERGVCEFPDTESDLEAVDYVRRAWRGVAAANAMLPAFVFGFPNITHARDEATRIEWLGLLAMPADLLSAEERKWDGFGETPPQLVAELDPGATGPDPGAPEALRKALERWLERLLAEVREGERPQLGGFSGAPLFLVYSGHVSLIAIMKEGGPQFGERLVAFMSCWDDVLFLFRRDCPEALPE